MSKTKRIFRELIEERMCPTCGTNKYMKEFIRTNSNFYSSSCKICRIKKVETWKQLYRKKKTI